MGKTIFLCLVLTLLPGIGIFAQEGISIRGTVMAADSKEPLVGVVVLDTLSKQYTVSDGYGFFALALPQQEACLVFQYTGFDRQYVCGVFKRGEVLKVALSHANYLPQVEVSAAPGSLGEGIGIIALPVKTIQLLPQLGGETDLLKTMALMPGVALGVEGSTGLHIRGGSPDQSLVLLDEAPVYNISHFGAFLSVFNADVVKDIKIYKGGWPAHYGGRLSGLVDIHTREGNLNYWQGKMTISPLLGRFSAEGPIVPGKTSLLVSGRSSWLGLLFNAMSDSGIRQRYLMYDINAKIAHHFNDRNKLYASYYSSLDDSRVTETINRGGLGNRRLLSSNSQAGVDWGNQTATLRYASFIKDGWVLQSVLYYTAYRFNSFDAEQILFEDGGAASSSSTNSSSNRDIGLKTLLSYSKGKFSMKTGAEWVNQRFQPNSAFVSNNDSTALLSDAKAIQQNYFWDGEFHPSSRVALYFGLRYTRHNTLDTVYPFLEPRFRLGVNLSEQWQFSFNAHYGQQYLHLLSGGNTGLLNEVWMGSTARVPPQRGGQLATGLSWHSKDKSYRIELEGFYKKMDNLLEFKSVTSGLSQLSEWEDLVETDGEGEVLGLELLLRKQAGRLTGWLAYTLSKSSRRFDAINRGAWFPFRFDRRHDLALVMLYALNEKWSLSATWVYQTGSYITLPSSKIPVANIVEEGIFFPGGVNINERRNNAQLPAYHRLDLSSTYAWKGKRRGRPCSLGFSIYNAYNRINPYFISTETEPVFSDQGQYMGQSPPKVVVVGLFPFIPSVSFSCEFGQTNQ